MFIIEDCKRLFPSFLQISFKSRVTIRPLVSIFIANLAFKEKFSTRSIFWTPKICFLVDISMSSSTTFSSVLQMLTNVLSWCLLTSIEAGKRHSSVSHDASGGSIISRSQWPHVFAKICVAFPRSRYHPGGTKMNDAARYNNIHHHHHYCCCVYYYIIVLFFHILIYVSMMI